MIRTELFFRRLRCQRLDRELAAIRFLHMRPQRPEGMGWVRHLRRSMGMPGAILARRVGISRQSLWELEAREHAGTITLNALARAADGLECDVVYLLLPRGSLALRRLGRFRVMLPAPRHREGGEAPRGDLPGADVARGEGIPTDRRGRCAPSR